VAERGFCGHLQDTIEAAYSSLTACMISSNLQLFAFGLPIAFMRLGSCKKKYRLCVPASCIENCEILTGSAIEVTIGRR
jgi:hypothetical protein